MYPSLVPRHIIVGKVRLVSTVCASRNFPAFRRPRISSCDVRGMITSIRIRGRIINCVRDIIIMATRVEDLDHLISYTIQRLGCSATTLKPEHGVSVKSIYDVSGWFWQVAVDLYVHAIGLTLRPSRSLILDTRLCFTDEGLNSNAAWLELDRHYCPTQTAS